MSRLKIKLTIVIISLVIVWLSVKAQTNNDNNNNNNNSNETDQLERMEEPISRRPKSETFDDFDIDGRQDADSGVFNGTGFSLHSLIPRIDRNMLTSMVKIEMEPPGSGSGVMGARRINSITIMGTPVYQRGSGFMGMRTLEYFSRGFRQQMGARDEPKDRMRPNLSGGTGDQRGNNVMGRVMTQP
ncbi:hypothetical protein GZH46_00458 [Fragariocoptes setiger]|uniref:Secreted protein n=1 Tax=Fragariocoptes setiger TaxID=1670756 RepID=A0ABQ7SC62_9ACAR|nr:hypothetical protein GZH46_00458 [Fragariocoptes setiger]